MVTFTRMPSGATRKRAGQRNGRLASGRRIRKINTAAQITLAVLLLAKLGLGMVHDYGVIDAMVAIVAATTVLSGGAYVAIWGWRIFRTQDTR